MNVNNVNMVISEKLDGLSIEIVYENGKLVKAITRGDGNIGEVITSNVIRMQNVKSVLPISYSGSIHGEILMKKKDFEDVNFICETRKENKFQNPRNAASGIARRFDGKYSEYLIILYYDVLGNFKTKKEIFNFLEKDLQLQTCPHYFGNIETAKITFNEYEQSIRSGLDYFIDGLVIELDDLKKIEKLGFQNNNPIGKIAWKFGAETTQTKVVEVQWQLGNSSRITPVLIMEPVNLCGVNIQRASVHNLAMFKEFNFHKGDIVLIERANDVIPFIKENLSNHPGNERGMRLEVPSVCPECGEKVSDEGIFLICKNESCCGNEIGNLVKWIKKLDLKGIAKATIEKLYEANLVKNPSDFYKLRKEMICELEGFGARSAEMIIETLNSKKEVTFGEFTGGLNIPNFSDKTAELLEENGYDTFYKILNASVEELSNIKGIGEITAKAILGGIEKKNQIIHDLLVEGIKIKERKVVTKNQNPFTGKKVVFTGALNIKRSEAQKMVIEVGGECPSSLSKDTDYLVMAVEDSISSKAMKAKQYGTKILNEDQFIQMIQERN